MQTQVDMLAVSRPALAFYPGNESGNSFCRHDRGLTPAASVKILRTLSLSGALTPRRDRYPRIVVAPTLAQALEIPVRLGTRLKASDQHLLKRTTRAEIERPVKGPEPLRGQFLDETGAALT